VYVKYIFNLSSTPWEISMISKGASNQLIYKNETLMNIKNKISINTYIDNKKNICFGGWVGDEISKTILNK